MQCGIFGPLRAFRVSWWNSCPLSSRKVITPLAKEVPVNYFLSAPSLSLKASSADVAVGDQLLFLCAVMTDLYG